MDSSNEDVLEGVEDLSTRTVSLDLEFLFNTFLRDGNELHLKVVRGIPDGANTVAAGILNNALLVVFDREVPSEVVYEVLNAKTKTLTEIN